MSETIQNNVQNVPTVSEVVPTPATTEAAAPQVQIKAATPSPYAFDSDLYGTCRMYTHADIMPADLKSRRDGEEKAINCYFLARMGTSLGLTLEQSLMGIFIIRGRPALYAKTKLALVQTRGGKVETSYDPDKGIATCKITRHDTGAVTEITYGLGDALAEKHLAIDPNTNAYIAKADSAWEKSWKTMLTWRAVGRACDLAYADLLLGLGTVEDLEEQPAKTTVKVDFKADRSALDVSATKDELKALTA